MQVCYTSLAWSCCGWSFASIGSCFWHSAVAYKKEVAVRLTHGITSVDKLIIRCSHMMMANLHKKKAK